MDLGEDREEDEPAQADDEVGYANEAYAPGELLGGPICIYRGCSRVPRKPDSKAS